MPISALKNWPFDSFLIPGVILFSVLGVVPLLTCFALIKRPKSRLGERLNLFADMYWGWTFCIYIAFGLIIWLQVEMSLMQMVHWAHSLYMAWAIAIIFVALLPQVRSLYKR